MLNCCFVILFVLLVCGVMCYFCLFYPQQSIAPHDIYEVQVTTPEPEKYHNDVLHPCIRRMSDGRYVMVQSPWYKCKNEAENPILYISHDPMHLDKGIVVADTPSKGYNSDPNVYEENGRIYVFWREVLTPLCNRLGAFSAVVGVYTEDDGKNFSKKQVYLVNNDEQIETVICPILMRYDGQYRFYASWYNIASNERRNLGVAIWEGTSLGQPDFQLVKKVPFRTKYICDKYKQLKVFGHIFFIPIPHKFDLWHFDLLEKDGKLLMLASEEMGDVEMMAVSDDWEHFQLKRQPLINAHHMENHVGYRQNYYKPTAFLREDDKIQFYYTTNRTQNSYTYQLNTFTFNA